MSGPRCGHTEVKGGTEFVCIREPHDDGTPPPEERIVIDAAGPRPATPVRTPGMLPAEVREADRHYMVNRWPNRAPA